MTLEEAIKHCEDVADTPCFTDEEARCYSEHRQLAEWLKELKQLREQKPKSEWEHDHEILKAYSDGASAVLDNVRAEIEERKLNSGGEPNRELAFNVCLQIIDNYAEEDKA